MVSSVPHLQKTIKQNRKKFRIFLGTEECFVSCWSSVVKMACCSGIFLYLYNMVIDRVYFQVFQSKFTKQKIKQAISELKKTNPSVQCGCFIAENEVCKNLLKLLGAENNSVNRKKLGRQYSMVSLLYFYFSHRFRMLYSVFFFYFC